MLLTRRLVDLNLEFHGSQQTCTSLFSAFRVGAGTHIDGMRAHLRMAAAL